MQTGRRKKICVITTSRAEYGVLRWTMTEIRRSPRLELQVIATGAHLSREFGSTHQMISRDGFRIDARVPMGVSPESPLSIANSMSLCLRRSAHALSRLRPDIVLLAGDRYELLPICSAALVLNIPIAHMSGGDVTEGSIDNQVRHAVTKMAALHFPGTAPSARRIVQMGEDPRTVFLVGEPGPETFRRTPPILRREVARSLSLEFSARWILFTYHPETGIGVSVNLRRLRNSLALLSKPKDVQAVLLYPNADLASDRITHELRKVARRDSGRFLLFPNLPSDLYTNLMRHAYCMVGNSSAGLLEAPSARLPVIDIGDRQKGRLRAGNVIHSDGSTDSLQAAWRRVESRAFRHKLGRLHNPFGDGRTGARIARILASVEPDNLARKGFYQVRP